MVKGENSASDRDNRRKSMGSLSSLQPVPEGTETHHVESQIHGSGNMPSLEECRYLDSQGQHVDVDKLHHHHHHRTISDREQFEDRIRKGDVSMKDIETLQRLAMEKNDDRNVLAGMSDSIEMSGVRKSQRKMSGMQTLFSATDISASLDKFPMVYDRNPREAFVELEELTKHGEEMEWKETARWIKFEENVEDSNRWGKPHVASLTFHSLLELMQGLEKGTVLLDLEKFDLPSIAEAVVENMVLTDQLKQKDSNKVLAALLLRHRHQHQQDPWKRRTSSKKNKNKLGVGTDILAYDGQSICETGNGVVGVKIIDKPQDPNTLEVSVDENENKPESDVKEKIPPGAEATNVLVGTLDELEHSVLAFVRLAKGTHLGEMTEVSIPVRFLFVLLGPSSHGDTYHQIGRAIATLMSDQAFHDVAYCADTREELLQAINEFLMDTVVLPPGNWDRSVLLPILIAQSRAIALRRKMAKAASSSHSDGESALARTGTFFGGLFQDVKRRGKFYISDFKDGFNLHTLFASLFLYFALFATNIAFGGLLEDKTGGQLGVTEVIFAASACSILFALFAGQPIMIIGATGPILVFEQSIYEFCKAYDVEFLTWRCWIGFWVMIILFGVVALEGCFLIKYFTRFTEDIFELLISAIFIYEPIALLIKLFKKNPLNRKGTGKYGDGIEMKGEPNTALLSTILVLGTFFIAFYMRKIKTSHFLGKRTRRLVSDSGIVTAMLIMAVLDYFLEDKVVTPHVSISDPLNEGFHPTTYPKRGWFINPGGMDKSMSMAWIFAAIIPAVFVGILLFMETEMTGVLLSKKEHKLAKGPGFNLDMVVVGVLAFGCSLLGLPWMCADTVRSASHVNALTIYSTSHAPGEKAHIITVKEQRISNIIIHLLSGLSILLAPGLHLIPIPIFFGVLLYLGIVSMYGLQMVDRWWMLFMPHKHHPDVPYVRKVRTKKIHCWTIIQTLALAFIVGIKLSPLAPSFPFFIICLIPLRKLLTKFYNEEEIHELDNSESEDEDSDYD